MLTHGRKFRAALTPPPAVPTALNRDNIARADFPRFSIEPFNSPFSPQTRLPQGLHGRRERLWMDVRGEQQTARVTEFSREKPLAVITVLEQGDVSCRG